MLPKYTVKVGIWHSLIEIHPFALTLMDKWKCAPFVWTIFRLLWYKTQNMEFRTAD